MKISIIIPVYNRAQTIGRAIESILKQSYQNFEIIVIDDGSEDKLDSVLANYNDSRIKIVKHSKNMGVNAAKNTGFDNIVGDWFTILDSDDEIVVPNALEEFVDIIRKYPEVTAITCNCIDTSTNTFSGIGLDKDQWLDWKTIIRKCKGEFWGLTKTELLGDLRLNEKLWGQEDVLWHKINKKAKRFYIHKALRIYHTEGHDRISSNKQSEFNLYRKYVSYVEIFKEREYIQDIKNYGVYAYRDLCFDACLTSIEYGDRKFALTTFLELIKTKESALKSLIILSGIIFGKSFLDIMKVIKKKYLKFTLK